MASLPTAILALEKQEALSNAGAWANPLNQGLDGVDTSIAGQLSVSSTGGDTNLTAVNFSTDQSRNPIIRISIGQTLVGQVNVYSGRRREYIVSNESSAGAFSVTFGWNSSNRVTINRGNYARILIKSDNTVQQVGPQMVIATNKVDQAFMPAVPGDMLRANNLSDVSNTATAFANIKQAATTSVTGVVEIATSVEVQAGASTTLVAAPNGVAAAISDAVSALRNGASASFDTLLELQNALATKMIGSNNLSDVASPASSRINLGLAYASSADMQNLASNVVVTPNNLFFSPFAAHAYARCDSAGNLYAGSYGISSVSHASTGIFNVTLSFGFTAANTVIMACPQFSAASNRACFATMTGSSTFQILCVVASNGAVNDFEFQFVVFGGTF